MTNNLNLILPLLHFDLGSYHVQILQRSKDGHDKATRTICEWFVSSEDKLRFLMPGIEALCIQYNARCYINVNPKKDEAVCWKIAECIVERLKSRNYNAISLLSHAHDSIQGNGVKYWVIDIDDNSVDLYEVMGIIDGCKSGKSPNVVGMIPSKSGWHLITVPFDITAIPKNISDKFEIKKNASTILFCT